METVSSTKSKNRYYVLFEESQTEREISTKDVMGITFDKDYAIKWVNENSEYRSYKETSLIDSHKDFK